MSLQKFFFGMGLWVLLLPYLGFPSSTDTVLFFISGLLLMYGAYRMKTKEIIEIKPIRKTTTSRSRSKKEEAPVVADMHVPPTETEVVTEHFNDDER